MTTVLLVMLGGGVGAAARVVVDAWVRSRAAGSLPLGTVTVNVTGSLLIGLLTGAGTGWAPELLVPLTVGVCGGYTTFSAAAVETVRLVQAGETRAAGLNVAATTVLTVGAVALGIAVGRALPT